MLLLLLNLAPLVPMPSSILLQYGADHGLIGAGMGARGRNVERFWLALSASPRLLETDGLTRWMRWRVSFIPYLGTYSVRRY